MTGINVNPEDPNGRPDPQLLRDMGFRWVRMVSRQSAVDYAEQCHAARLMVLAVVARESEGFVMPNSEVTQFGNEPDSSGPSSWTMSATEYAREFNFYQDTYPDLTWIAAGLASGQATYWRDVVTAGLHNCAGLDVHPYNKTAAEARRLLVATQQYSPSLPMWCTEWHRPEAEIPAFTKMLRENTVMDAWFAWSSPTGAMVRGFELSPSAERLLAAAR